MRFLCVIALLSMVTSCAVGDAVSAKSNGEITIYDRIHKKGELPTGGEFVEHPKKPKVQYYFTNRMRMWKDKGNAQKHSGLYITEDGGDTWKLRCDVFEFQTLFIHPESEKLYSIIDYTWLEENKEGFLESCFANKALISEDGRRWKDITGGNGYIATITGIMADPDNPGRVCLKASLMRACILQSEDAEYSKWTWYRAWDWPKRKERTTSQHTPGAYSSGAADGPTSKTQE